MRIQVCNRGRNFFYSGTCGFGVGMHLGIWVDKR
jgi:hypothetical protein